MSVVATILAAITVGVVEVLIFLLAPVVSATATLVITRANEASNRRRDRYALAVQTLVAWTEFPYRVKRRTDDDPATLTALTSHGHDLQERLAYHQARIATDHPDLARAYAETRSVIADAVGPAIREAWMSNPATLPADMNLGGWGPGEGCRQAVTALQDEIQNRFGFRRFRRFLSRTRIDDRGSPDDPIPTPEERPTMDYETVFNRCFRRKLIVGVTATAVIFLLPMIWRLVWHTPKCEDLVSIGRWMLSALSTFILASMVLFWWLRRTISPWPSDATKVVIVVFLLSWALFFLSFVAQVASSLASDAFFSAWSVGLAAGSTLSLFGVGLVGVRVLDAHQELQR